MARSHKKIYPSPKVIFSRPPTKNSHSFQALNSSISILFLSIEGIDKLATDFYSCQSVNNESVHIISKRPFNEAARRFPRQRSALAQTYRGLKQGRFESPDELRRVFLSLDNFRYRDKWWVLDIGGNHLRLIAYIHFAGNRMYVKHIVTHAEYDKLCSQYAKGEI